MAHPPIHPIQKKRPKNGAPPSKKAREVRGKPLPQGALLSNRNVGRPQRIIEKYESQLELMIQVLNSYFSGDFTVRMPETGDGKLGEIFSLLNRIVIRSEQVSSELMRVSSMVGSEGKLNERASVSGLTGTWAYEIEAVNLLVSSLARPTTEVARVMRAVAAGDLSQKITIDSQGEILEVKDTINTMVDTLRSFSAEVTRVAKEVGTEGRLGGQADVKGVSGTWKDLTDNVNAMASNLTVQLRDVSKVATAIANGDLTQKITVDVKGEILQIKDVINKMVDTLRLFSAEVTRVAREVGTEGKLGGQADAKGVSGNWKDLTDNVNAMASNLTVQLRDVSKVATAIANGDLTQKITVDVKGEILQIKNVINKMVDTLRSFSSEVTRVAKEVGTEGKLGGQADVKGVAGTWKDLTDNVNAMATNLTVQLRDVSKVATAIANGDLGQKITVDVKGEILQIKDVINKMVDQLNSFASEVTRVAREVGTEGKLGGQAEVRGVSGTWKDLTENVNSLTANLTAQVRNIAKVTTAVANGDLSQKITVDVRGEVLELKDTINTMVDQLSSFADEVTRVAKEVGTEGKLGGQANVKGVSGTWKDLTDNVNAMASNLTVQLRDVSKVATAIANGDLGQKITVDVKGEILQIKNVINKMVDQLNSFAAEVTRVAKEVGTEGKLGGQAEVKGVSGTWKDLTDNVNFMAGNLTKQVRGIVKVVTAVANGDLNQKFVLEAKGEVAALAETINSMTDTLRIFADQVTTVAREVGVEGKLGAQARVPGVAGTWKDLTDNVNAMAANLTVQLRDVSKVATAIANGDLGQKISVDVRGEILQIKDVINKMVDTLRIFADQVTSVAREVGIEGKLGGQAKVPGAAGTWRDLTDNVNQLAGNLTTQVRAIAEVATAVTKGDLTRAISVEAQGEVSQLKDNINQMINNLRETTIANKEQDWLKTNLAKFSGMMQGQRSIESLANLIMSELTPVVSAQYGAFYIVEIEGERPILKMISSYAYQERKKVSNRFALGESLVGQSALEKKFIRVRRVPDDYIQISSGLGEAPPRNITVFPVVFEGNIKAVIELASFEEFSVVHLSFLEQLMQSIGVVFNMIGASMRTEELLQELQRSNAQLEGRSKELEDKASLLEVKNVEIAKASATLEEKAKELSQISKYKSDFLANMSHELRTPLNSLLILAKMLAENTEGTLTPKQVEFAKTIYASGNDLLSLINEILDLSKIEAGKMQVDLQNVRISEVQEFVERTFREIAVQKHLDFYVILERDCPSSFVTDPLRLNQILKNLLSNSFKFTEHGSVKLKVRLADPALRFQHPELKRSKFVMEFLVEDTGIGIPPEKQKIIFEAFQQADTTTARKYGGTGLGLTISRELVRILGGELALKSTPGRGSSFSLYLPYNVESSMSETRYRSRSHSSLTESVIERANPSLTEVRENLGGTRVLLIDDDPRNLYAIANLLERQEARVKTVNNAVEGIEVLRQSPSNFDVVLLDIVMPGMDGFQALREIKNIPEISQVPVVAVTGKAMPGDREKCFELGVADFVSDPANPDILISTIQKVIHPVLRQQELAEFYDYGKQSEVKAPEPAVETRIENIGPSADEKSSSLVGKKILLIDDDPRNLFAVASFLESCSAKVVSVDNAREGIQLLQAEPGFDVVLMDIMMPEMDGYEATRQIRKLPEFSGLPIIAVTAKAMAEDRKNCEDAGCTDFVPKPISNDQLLVTILSHLSKKEM